MKEKISVRQICFILIAYNAATKMIIYPTFAASELGNALIFPALFDLLLQSVIIWSVAYLSSRTNKTFFSLLQESLGKVAARIIYALFALYFLMLALVPLGEQELLVSQVFFDVMPLFLGFLPIFVFTVYAGVKGFTNIGRCADLCLPVFCLTLAFFLLSSVETADYSNMLPVLTQPAGKLFSSTVGSFFRFSEGSFLLLFMGHYEYKKGDAAKMTISYVLGGLAVIALMIAFYSVYGELAPTRAFALNSVAVFFSAIKFIGRLDLLFVYALDVVTLFAIALHVQAFVYCMCKVFNRNFRIIYSLAANAVLMTAAILVQNNFAALQTFAAQWFWIPTLVFAYVLPVVGWAMRRNFK